MKKILSCMISISLIVSSCGAAFATETNHGLQTFEQSQAEFVETLVGTKDVNDEVDIHGDDLAIEGEGLKLEVPKKVSLLDSQKM